MTIVLLNGRIMVCFDDFDSIKNIVREIHFTNGHIGIRRTFKKIQITYIGITEAMVANNIECNICNQKEKPQKRNCIPFIQTHPFERLVIDLIDYRKFSTINNEKKYLFTCIDSFSKFSWGFGIENKTTEFC